MTEKDSNENAFLESFLIVDPIEFEIEKDKVDGFNNLTCDFEGCGPWECKDVPGTKKVTITMSRKECKKMADNVSFTMNDIKKRADLTKDWLVRSEERGVKDLGMFYSQISNDYLMVEKFRYYDDIFTSLLKK